MQHPPEQPDDKQFMREFSGSVNVALLAMFSAATTAQLWSRWPGSPGNLFLGLYFVGALFAQALYIQIKTAVTGQFDSIPFQVILGINLVWFAVHGVRRAVLRSSGIHIHSHHPGYPIWAIFYPNLPNWLCALISDATVAIALALLFHLSGSNPHLRDWFAWIVLPSIVFSAAWVRAREGHLHQRYVDSTAEASHYANTIGRR